MSLEQDRLHGVRGEGVPEHEDGRLHTGLAKEVALVWPHDRETVHAGLLELGGEDGGARAVGVGLDHGDQLDGPEVLLERADVVGSGVEVDLNPAVHRLGSGREGVLPGGCGCQLTRPFPTARAAFDPRIDANLASDG